MSASFWTIMIVALNTPRAAVEIRPLPDSPAFQTRASCEDFAKGKGVPGLVCFTGGALLDLTRREDPKNEDRANVSVEGSGWGVSKR